MLDRKTMILFFVACFAFFAAPFVFQTALAQNVVQEMSADNVLFSDNFDEGINIAWIPLNGKWKMINERLQPVDGDPAEIMIGDPAWTDYVVEFDFFNLSTYYDDKAIIAGIRYNNDSKESYSLKMFSYYKNCFYEHPNGTELYFKTDRPYTKNGKVKIAVKNDLVKIYLDGEMFCSFTDDLLKQGNIVLKFFPDKDENPIYPSIDNFVINKN